MSVGYENREIPRQLHNSRFPMLKNARRNDTVHSDAFFPSLRTSQGHTCSQMFIGENTDFMHVEPMKSESASFMALRNFTRSMAHLTISRLTMLVHKLESNGLC